MPKGKRLGLKRTAKEWEISLAEHLGRAADKAPDVVMSLFSSHPALFGLVCMAGCTGGIIVADVWGRKPEPNENEREQWAELTKMHLENFYNGAQTLVEFLAVVPVVTGGLNILSSFLEARKTAPAT